MSMTKRCPASPVLSMRNSATPFSTTSAQKLWNSSCFIAGSISHTLRPMRSSRSPPVVRQARSFAYTTVPSAAVVVIASEAWSTAKRARRAESAARR